jgi:hypothetical protein
MASFTRELLTFLVVVEARHHGQLTQGQPQVLAAVCRGISVPAQQPDERQYFRGRDSTVLRRGHWHPSQLETNNAGEPEWKQLELKFIEWHLEVPPCQQ